MTDERSPITLGCLFLCASLSLSLAAVPCVSVRVVACQTMRTIRVALSPATVCALVKVQPDARHRLLRLTWDYAQLPEGLDLSPLSQPDYDAGDPFNAPEQRDGPVGSAEDDLDGAEEPLTTRPHGYKLLDLAHGTYEVRATTYRDREGKQACGSARTSVTVR